MYQRFKQKKTWGDIFMVLLTLLILCMGIAVLCLLPASWPDKVCFACIIGIAFIIGVRDR